MDYITIKEVMDNLLDDEMMSGLSFERAVKYSLDFIRKVGAPLAFEEKTVEVEVHNHRAQLPCDLVRINGVESIDKCHHHRIPYHQSTSTFEPTGLTYKIQGSFLISSKREDLISINYNAIPVDCDGYPMIPDNGKVEPALELYIMKKYLTPKFRKGELNANVIQHLDQEYAFAIGQANTSLLLPNEDEMESFKNMWNNIIEKRNDHIRSFRTTDKPEIIKNF